MEDKVHPLWKGDNVKKRAKHKRITNKYGKAIKCEKCNIAGLPKYEWSNKNHKYSDDITEWQQLCQKCHRKYDIEHNGIKCGGLNKGKKMSEEQKIKIGNANRGHKHTEESKNKMSEMLSGKKRVPKNGYSMSKGAIYMRKKSSIR